MKKIFLLLIVLLIPAPCFPVTVMKSVGHGDCYLVVADGRRVLIDVGPASDGKGLVSLVKAGHRHFDRIVITHVHSDHVGGIITAEQYANEQDSPFSVDSLVSNHGKHDLDVVTSSAGVRSLVESCRSTPVVVLSDDALARAALDDESIEVRAYPTGEPGGNAAENKTGLVVKVTEIRDGQRRATLFLGDIEQAQQLRLLSSSQAHEMFQDVYAVTLPHHGRTTTLGEGFISSVRNIAGRGIAFLHSDSKPLDADVVRQIESAGCTLKSTASSGRDIVVDSFGGHTYYAVGDKPVKLMDAAKSAKEALAKSCGFTDGELARAVASYGGYLPSDTLPPGHVMDIPTDACIRSKIARERREYNKVTEDLIKHLSGDDAVAYGAKQGLRTRELSPAQSRRAAAAWRVGSTGREIRAGLRSGWSVKRHPNIDDCKLFVYARRGRSGPSYVVKDADDGLWHIYAPGRSRRGVPSYGRSLGTMRRPGEVNIIDSDVCEYCGRPSIGHCHMRNRDVCETHRRFTIGGQGWICP